MTGARRFSVSTPDWGQAHLSLDAIVAYVDDELAPGARTRAEAHLASCADCRAEVVAQRQTRSTLRAAGGPQLPSSLLHSLRAIPVDAELPPMPPGLAVTADGQFVLLRDVPPDHGGHGLHPGAGPAGLDDVPPAGLGPDPASAPRRFSRRARIGAVSGLAFGALAVGALAAPAEQGAITGGAVLNVPAQTRLGPDPGSVVPAVAAVPPAAPRAPLENAPLQNVSATSAGSVVDARLRERLDRMPAAFRLDGP
jgi:Putative zinc-finger